MEVITGIIGLAIFVGLVYLYQKGRNAAAKAVNRTLMGGTYKRGQELIHHETVVTLDLPLAEAQRRVALALEPDSPPRLVRVHVMPVDDDAVVYVRSNLLGEEQLRYGATLTKLDDDRTRVNGALISWMEMDGMLAAQDELRRLQTSLEALGHVA